MRKFLKSGAAIGLAAAVVFGAAACSGNGGNKSAATEAPANNTSGGNASAVTETSAGSGVSAPGVFPIVGEKVTISVAAQHTDYVGDLNTNRFGAWYEEKTNVHVDYMEIPADPSQRTEQVNLLLISGNLPDIFMNTVVDANLNGSRGTYIALNDLIDKQGFETKKVFAAKSEYLPGMVTAVDGNIYQLPDINECFHCANNIRAWINQSWLDKLGLSYPETTDDFANVLRAFKTQDPNGNGVQDEIPMSGSAEGWNEKIYPFLLNSFVPFYDGEYTYLKNGKIEFVANTDAFRDGLRWIKGLVDEGLIDPLSLTQAELSLQMVGYAPDETYLGVVTAALWASVMPMGDVEDPAASEDFNFRSRNYVGLSPLKGPNGVRHSPTTATGVGVGSDGAVITKNCKNPEVAFKWLDGLYNDEVTMMSQAGLDRGTPPEGATGINGKPALYIPPAFSTLEEAGASKSWMQNVAMSNRTSDFRLGEMADYTNPATQWSMEPRLYNETAKYFQPFGDTSMAVPALAFTEEEDSARSMYYTQIKDYVQESIVQFITGGKDIEGGWDAYIKEFGALKLDAYMELLQKAYDRQYK